jgi:hypothetical protein
MQRLFNGLGRSGQKPGSTAIKVISVARSTVDVRHCHYPNHDCAPYPIFVPSSVMRPLSPGEYCAHPTPRRATHTSHRYFTIATVMWLVLCLRQSRRAPKSARTQQPSLIQVRLVPMLSPLREQLLVAKSQGKTRYVHPRKLRVGRF